MAEHKAVLRARYEEARALGSQVSAAKQGISDLKAAMERRRLGRSMAALLRQQQGGEDEDEAERQREAAEEERAKAQIEQEKAAYRTAYEQLKGVKADIDGVQAALERSRVRLQADFQAWYAAMAAGAAGSLGAPAAAGGGGAGSVDAPAAAAKVQSLPQQAGQRQRQQQQHQAAGQEWAIAAARPHSGRSAATMQHGTHAPPSPPEAAGLPSFASWKTAGSFQFDRGSPGGQPGLSAVPAGQTSAAAATPKPQLPVVPSSAALAALTPPNAAAGAAAVSAATPATDEPSDPTAGVDPEVLAAAKPLLTGIAAADRDIIRFYEARAALLKGMRA